MIMTHPVVTLPFFSQDLLAGPIQEHHDVRAYFKQAFLWQAGLMNKMNPSPQGQASDQPSVAGRDVF